MRSGPRPWVVVLWTLGAVALAAGLFIGGIVVGIALAGVAPSTTSAGAGAGSGTGPSVGTGTSAGTGAGASSSTGSGGSVVTDLDPCLVGTWTTVSHTESADTPSGKLTVTNLRRNLTIKPDGTETVTYEHTPATMTTDKGDLTAVFSGTVVYRISTSGTTLKSALVSSDATMAVTGSDGQTQTQDVKPGTEDVQYTCSATRYTESSAGYEAVFQRATP